MPIGGIFYYKMSFFLVHIFWIVHFTVFDIKKVRFEQQIDTFYWKSNDMYANLAMESPGPPKAQFWAKIGKCTLFWITCNFLTYCLIIMCEVSKNSHFLKDYGKRSKVTWDDTLQPLKVAVYSSATVSQIDPCLFFNYRKTPRFEGVINLPLLKECQKCISS